MFVWFVLLFQNLHNSSHFNSTGRKGRVSPLFGPSWSLGGSHHVVCQPVVLCYKVCKSLWHHVMKCVRSLFLFKTLSNLCCLGHISPDLCARNFDIVTLKTFTFLSCWINTHILKAFSITLLTQFVKKEKRHPLLGLSLLLTICPLIVQSLFNSLAISLTAWPEDCKNRCLSSSTNRVGPSFSWKTKNKTTGMLS